MPIQIVTLEIASTRLPFCCKGDPNWPYFLWFPRSLEWANWSLFRREPTHRVGSANQTLWAGNVNWEAKISDWRMVYKRLQRTRKDETEMSTRTKLHSRGAWVSRGKQGCRDGPKTKARTLGTRDGAWWRTLKPFLSSREQIGTTQLPFLSWWLTMPDIY